MERAEYLRARSWANVARKREATALRYAGDVDYLAREYQDNANSAWIDAVVAMLRALGAP